MARKPKVLIGFSRLKDDELMAVANTIVAAMSQNPHYPTPAPALASIAVLEKDFLERLARSKNGTTKLDTELKKESRLALTRSLQQLGHYVNTVAEGQLSKLLSSGFPLERSNSSRLIPHAVENIRLSDGRQSRQVRLDFKRQLNVLLYEYRYRKVGNQKWTDHLFTTSSRGNIISNLEIARFYEVQARAINTQGPGEWSESATLLVR